MAELAASILGIVSFGVGVGKALNDAAHDMIYAQKQINSIKTHVAQFNSVLKHLATVLEADENTTLCSRQALKDIKRITRSCKKTFKEIKRTVESRSKSRVYKSLRWIFKKQHAREIEARLNAQKSTLQSMIETITLSKLAELASQYVLYGGDLSSLIHAGRQIRNI